MSANSYTDRFEKAGINLESPVCDGFSPTANSTNVFTQPTRTLYVGTGGTVTVQMKGKVANTTVSFLNVSNGSFLPARVQIIYANSTANDFLGLY